MVVMHSENFHGVGLDMHVRTTIQNFFSYIEAAAVKVGNDIVELANGSVKLNGVDHSDEDLPLVFGEGDTKYSVYMHKKETTDEGTVKRRTYRLKLDDDTAIEFRFYKKFNSFKILGHIDFHDSVGLMGQYPTGAMLSRGGKVMDDFEQFSFEWQVSPQDPVLFSDARAPQLPNEKCRMPNQSHTSRRRLKRGNRELLESAQEACSGLSEHNRELCVDDVMMTGDLGMAGEW